MKTDPARRRPWLVTALLLVGFGPGAFAVLPAPTGRGCQGDWLWAQAGAHLKAPYSLYDYSGEPDEGKEEGEQKPVEAVAPGRLKFIVGALERAMKAGATTATNIAIAGPDETLAPILDQLLPRLKRAHLPHLAVLLIGPPSLEDKAGAAFRRLGAAFAFVPFERRSCGARPAAPKPGPDH